MADRSCHWSRVAVKAGFSPLRYSRYSRSSGGGGPPSASSTAGSAGGIADWRSSTDKPGRPAHATPQQVLIGFGAHVRSQAEVSPAGTVQQSDHALQVCHVDTAVSHSPPIPELQLMRRPYELGEVCQLVCAFIRERAASCPFTPAGSRA